MSVAGVGDNGHEAYMPRREAGDRVLTKRGLEGGRETSTWNGITGQREKLPGIRRFLATVRRKTVCEEGFPITCGRRRCPLRESRRRKRGAFKWSGSLNDFTKERGGASGAMLQSAQCAICRESRECDARAKKAARRLRRGR